jgi:hypothetical protein
VVGKGWLNSTDCVVPPFAAFPWPFAVRWAPFGAMDWIVVRVVARDLTEGEGEENVLSPPLRDSNPPPAVRLVPASDEAPCEGAVIECEASWSVDTVGATDRAPAVGGARPSMEDRMECLSREVALPLWAVENE